MKEIFLDLETTGTKPDRHSIRQIAAIIRIDGEIKETLDIRVKPYKEEVSLSALDMFDIAGLSKG